MTPREAFKLGFLSKVAELGLTPSQFEQLIEKRAVGFSDIYGAVTQPVKDLLGLLGSAGVPLLLAAGIGGPLALGKLTGYLHANMYDVSPEDIERSKMQDYTNTYRSEAQRIKRKMERDKWRKGKRSAGVVSF